MKRKINTRLLTLVTLIGALICAVFAAFMVLNTTQQASAASAAEPNAATLGATPAPQSAQTLAAAWNAAVQESLDGNGKQVTFTLTEDWTAQPDDDYTTSFGSGVGFDEGRIAIPNNADMVLDLGAYTIDRGLTNKDAIEYGGVIILIGSSNLEIRGTTGAITGGNTTGAGGGVGARRIEEDSTEPCNGTITLTSGNIVGNSSFRDGGGICASDGKSFIMNGGTVTDNKSTNAWGGGIYTSTNAIINDGIISGNYARSQGGGIGAYGGSVTINGGKITANTANSGGGGVATRLLLTLNNGIIGGATDAEGNVSLTAAGGGVYFLGTFNMKNGTISHNKALSGGGVYAWSSTMTMDGGSIDNNKATGRTNGSQGGGLLFEASCTFTMNGGKITQNKTFKSTANEGNAYAGAIYSNGSNIIINDGEISDNEADAYGAIGGWSPRITLNGGLITRNKATGTSCGAICVNVDGWMIMNGGTISDNTANTNSGGIAVTNANTKLTINGGTISGNSANSNGGGVYSSGILTITGGTISGNSAATNGGGVYIASNSVFQLGGAAVIENNQVSGSANNLYFPNNTNAIVTGVLSGAKIGVTMQTAGAFTSGYSSYNNIVKPAMFFFADNGNEIVLDGREAAIGTGTAPAAPTKTLTWQYREKDGAWKTAPTASIAYTGLTYEVQAIYTSGSTTEKLTIAKTSYKDINGNVATIIRNAGTYSFLVNSTDYTNPAYVLTITPLELTVAWDASDIYYSGSVQTPAYTISGVLESDKNHVSALVNTTKAGTNAGNNYSVSLAGLTGVYAVNYKFKAGTPTTATYRILKAKPTVAPDISLNKQLFAGNDLPAIATSSGNTAGKIAWSEATLSAGTKSYTWTFTPTDTTNYESISGSYVFTAEEVALASVSGTFNAGSNTVYTTTTFDQLKSYITLTGTNNDGTTFTITDYEMYGELTEGESVLTIVYEGISTEITVTGVQGVGGVTLSNITAQLGANSQTDYTAFDKFNPAGITVTAHYSDGTSEVVANYTFTYADITKDYFVAGDYYVNVKYTDGTDTRSCQLSGLTVTKANPTVNPDISFNKALFEKENLPKIVLSSGDTAGTISWTEATLTAGTKAYTWVFTPTDITNYNTATGSYTFTAETLALKSITATYKHVDGFTVKTTTKLSDLKDKITVDGLFNDGTPQTNVANFDLFGTLTAGTATLTVSYGGLTTTVSIPNVELVETEIKVTDITVTVISIGTPIYPETSLDDIKDMLEVTATYSDGTTKTVNKDDYDLYATLKVGDSKLLVEYEGVTGSKIVTVQSSAGGGVRVSVKWMNTSFKYDGTEHLPTPYIEWDGEKILLEARLQANYDGISAGTQKVEAVEPDSGKYLLTGETVLTYTIEKAELSVVWTTDDGWTYNGEAQNPEAQLKASVNDGNLAISFKLTAKNGSALTDGKAVNAGRYVAEVVLSGADNYVINGNRTFEFTIAKKQLAKPTALTTEFTYNGAAQSYLPNGFDASLMTITGGTQTEAGAHAVTVELLDKTNYEWADGTTQAVNFTFSITAPPTIEQPTVNNNVGLSSGAIAGIIIALCAILLIALIALILALRKKSYADPDGFNDPINEEDLK